MHTELPGLLLQFHAVLLYIPTTILTNPLSMGIERLLLIFSLLLLQTHVQVFDLLEKFPDMDLLSQKYVHWQF